MSNKALKAVVSPRNTDIKPISQFKDVKKLSCLFVVKIIDEKLKKNLAFGLGKIMMESALHSQPFRIFI